MSDATTPADPDQPGAGRPGGPSPRPRPTPSAAPPANAPTGPGSSGAPQADRSAAGTPAAPGPVPLPTTQEPPVTQPPVTQPPVTQPPVTQPPVTQPPLTQPPLTQPPLTQPPLTQPPVTQPPVTQPPIAQGADAGRPAAAGAGGKAEYQATIVAPSQIAISVAIGVVLAVVLVGIRMSLWPLAIIVFVVVAGAGVYLAGVSLLVTPTHVELGQGRREREPRYIAADEITQASSADYTWGQVFGVGVPRAVKTTRLTVRPGPTLVLELRTGEVVRVSTPEPDQALAVLGRP